MEHTESQVNHCSNRCGSDGQTGSALEVSQYINQRSLKEQLLDQEKGNQY